MSNFLNTLVQDSEGKTPLHIAIEMGGYDSAIHLINCNNSILNIKDKFGKIPLQIAIENGESKIAKYILTKDFDIDSRDQHGNTSLYNTLILNDLEIAQILLKKGANPFIKNEDHITPSDLSLYKELVIAPQNSLPPSSKDSYSTGSECSQHIKFSNLYLQGAIQCLDFVNVIHFVNLAFNFNQREILNFKDQEGNTALHVAAITGQQDIAFYLFQIGCSFNIENASRKTFVDIAIENNWWYEMFCPELDFRVKTVHNRLSANEKENLGKGILGKGNAIDIMNNTHILFTNF